MSLVITGCDGSLGSPNPALFSAVTLNSYSTPSLRPCTLKRRSGIILLLARTHLIPRFSFLSTQYPLMSLPPSCAGLFHEMVTALRLTLSMSGMEGGPGGPDKRNHVTKVCFRGLVLWGGQLILSITLKMSLISSTQTETYGSCQSFLLVQTGWSLQCHTG